MKYLDWPPIWAVLCVFLSWMFAQFLPIVDLSGFYASWLWILLLVVAFIYIIWAEVEFLRHKTTVIPRRSASALLTTGPFKISRNPIYTGYALIILSIALKLGSLSAFLPLPFFVWIITMRFIIGEEAALLKVFGNEYSEWSQNTRRW